MDVSATILHRAIAVGAREPQLRKSPPFSFFFFFKHILMDFGLPTFFMMLRENVHLLELSALAMGIPGDLGATTVEGGVWRTGWS